jgi:hypothetical protein
VTEETLLEKAERLMALVATIAGERDDALKQLTVINAERDQMGAMLAEVESTIAQTLDTTELTPELTDKEMSLELDECRKALQEMKAELDRTREELARAEFKARSQAAKMKRQSPQGSEQY